MHLKKGTTSCSKKLVCLKMSCESVFEGQEYNGLSLKDCFVKGFGEEVFRMSRDYSNCCGRLAKWKKSCNF